MKCLGDRLVVVARSRSVSGKRRTCFKVLTGHGEGGCRHWSTGGGRAELIKKAEEKEEGCLGGIVGAGNGRLWLRARYVGCPDDGGERRVGEWKRSGVTLLRANGVARLMCGSVHITKPGCSEHC